MIIFRSILPPCWFALPFHFSRLDLSTEQMYLFGFCWAGILLWDTLMARFYTCTFWPQGPYLLTTVSNSKYRSILVMADSQGPNITMKEDRDSAGRPIKQSTNLKQETRRSNIDRRVYILIEILTDPDPDCRS